MPSIGNISHPLLPPSGMADQHQCLLSAWWCVARWQSSHLNYQRLVICLGQVRETCRLKGFNRKVQQARPTDLVLTDEMCNWCYQGIENGQFLWQGKIKNAEMKYKKQFMWKYSTLQTYDSMELFWINRKQLRRAGNEWENDGLRELHKEEK